MQRLAALTFFILLTSVISAEPRIYTFSSLTDTVDLGACMVGDSLKAKFGWERDGDNNYSIRATGSIVISRSPNDPTAIQHEEFEETIIGHLFLNSDNPKGEVDVFYFATEQIVPYPYGKREALLTMTLYDESGEYEAAVKEFILIARKSRHFIAKFDDTLSFDSVYVNTPNPSSLKLRLKNVWDEKLKLTGKETELLSSFIQQEYTFNGLDLPIDLSPEDSVEWNVNYLPKDLKPDTVLMTFTFMPIPGNPDSLVTDSAIVLGYGVNQEIKLKSANFEFINSDSLIINVGKIPIGRELEIEFSFENTGNIPIGIINQQLIDVGPGQRVNGEFLPGGMAKEGLHLLSNLQSLTESIDTTGILITPLAKGPFTLHYKITTDIFNRNIKGLQEKDKYMDVYIKGEALMPQLIVESDTIDFGDVVTSDDCPASRTVFFKLSNTGNYPLEIFSIQPGFSVPFDVNTGRLTIQPGKYEEIEVTFSPENTGDYSDLLNISTNEPPESNNTSVYLTGSGVPKETISISLGDNISVKPGNKILIEIISDSSKISLAQDFFTRIFYDKSILYYAGMETTGTAVEGISAEAYINEIPQGLELQMIRSGNENFIPVKKIIKLKFDTYMGNNLKTDLLFANSRFGNENCDNIFEIIQTNKIVELDSICGIERKAYQKNSGLSIISISPEPLRENAKIIFKCPSNGFVNLNVFDVHGRRIISSTGINASKGENSAFIRLAQLQIGVYILRLEFNGRYKEKQFIRH